MLRSRALVALLVLVASPLAHAKQVPPPRPARPGLLVIPAAGASDTTVDVSGWTVVPNDAAIDQLRQDDDRVRAFDREQLALVDKAFDDAQAAYLRQDFNAMMTPLVAVEKSALAVLARPEHIGTLWELVFQMGLAVLSRGEAKDAQSKFALALALAPDRRPSKDLYPPAVLEAFALAVGERDKRATRAVTIQLSPADARLVIDGVAVVDATRPIQLRPGVHVVLASAPGHQVRAAVMEVDAGISIALEPAGEWDGLGALWARGELSPDQPSTAQSLLELAMWANAGGVLVLDEQGGKSRAMLVTHAGHSAWVAGATPASAATGALAWLDADGQLTDPAGRGVVGGGGGGGKKKSVLKSPWLWGTVGVAVIGAVVIGVALSSDDGGTPVDHWHVVVK